MSIWLTSLLICMSIGVSGTPVTILDFSTGHIVGDRSDYTMVIPDNWHNHIIIERETLSPGSRILEKLNFYWQPLNHPPVFLANIFIFETRYSNEAIALRRILATDTYDFMIYITATELEFDNASDRLLYNYFVSRFGDINFLRELFVFPEGRGPVVGNRIFINGVEIEESVIYKNNNQPFIPLRAAAEALGYNVIWHGFDASILIEREGFEFTLFTNSPQNFGAVRVGNSFFVPGMFFVQMLNTNFERGLRGNVFITE